MYYIIYRKQAEVIGLVLIIVHCFMQPLTSVYASHLFGFILSFLGVKLMIVYVARNSSALHGFTCLSNHA
jgi:hypothetical protein